jgi:hypothetical protein
MKRYSQHFREVLPEAEFRVLPKVGHVPMSDDPTWWRERSSTSLYATPGGRRQRRRRWAERPAGGVTSCKPPRDDTDSRLLLRAICSSSAFSDPSRATPRVRVLNRAILRPCERATRSGSHSGVRTHLHDELSTRRSLFAPRPHFGRSPGSRLNCRAARACAKPSFAAPSYCPWAPGCVGISRLA